MADDVALDLAGSGFDGVAARAQIAVGPLAFIEGVRRSVRELAVRAEHFHGDLLEALVEFAPEDFLNGALRAGDSGFVDSRKRAHLVAAHHLDFGVHLRELLTDNGVVRAPALTRDFEQAVELAAIVHLKRGAESSAFVHQCPHGDTPSVVYFADNVFGRDADVAEEDFAELAFAAHLLEAAN